MIRENDISVKPHLYDDYREKLSLTVLFEYELILVYSYKKKTYLRLKHVDCGNIFDVDQYKFFSKGHRCPKEKGKRISNKLSKQESSIKDELFNLVQNEYELLDVIRKNKITYLKLKHNICNNIFEIEQYKFLTGGQRCPNEKNQRIANSKKYTHDDFVHLVSKLSNGEYTVVGKYIDSKTKILLRHEACGNEYEVLPSAFITGQRCAICRGGGQVLR